MMNKHCTRTHKETTFQTDIKQYQFELSHTHYHNALSLARTQYRHLISTVLTDELTYPFKIQIK